MPIDNHYMEPRLAAVYDIDCPWSADRDFYLSLAGQEPQHILDLGCGTGLQCNAYAEQGHHVTGVDPAPAMLDVARRKPHGGKVEWVCATAQDYRSDKCFDLIIMTGHAFQVLLHDEDIAATFKTMCKHLKPQGIAAFESRNPAIDWAGRWNCEITLPGGHTRQLRMFKKTQNNFLHFENRYIFPDEVLTSTSNLRFMTDHDIVTRLTASGLGVRSLLGDWAGNSFAEKSSEEMIYVVGQNKFHARAKFASVPINGHQHRL
jgi:2-polyprenyl-3-methyl-5-hydroxy-6-metoxy-1,4-benzoquinol methylase